MAKVHTKFLLTEGKNDAYAIAGLMANYVAWGKSEDEWPVKIEAAGQGTQGWHWRHMGGWSDAEWSAWWET